MAFNGSGVFQRLYSWVNDAAANIKIRADRMDNEMEGFAVGLSTCITKDGQTTITANLPMSGFRHTGVGNASNRTDYASFGQVQDGKAAWVAAGGTADAITAAYTIPITALVDGQQCFVRASAANTTTTPTFSPNGLTARTIVKNNGSALVAGDIAGAGHELQLRYDLTNTRWLLMNPKQPTVQTIPYVAASASGPASLEFAEDTDNGTNKVTLSAPAALAADRAVALPDASGEVLLDSATQTLTNKTITSPVLTLTQSASPTPTAEGRIEWDTDDNRIVVGDGSGQAVFYPVTTGTFTPTVVGSTTAGTATYSQQSGSWMRLGNFVFVTMTCVWSGGTGTGTLRLSGLPFNASQFAGITAYYDGIPPGSGLVLFGYTLSGDNKIQIATYSQTTGASSALTYDAAGDFRASFVYGV